ncbi:response to light stimulus [Cryphonectria parasitica EP155]|uniref:chitinase n=1 Tax=Cryphonectria parasitica (strain ATCC 38755 / EP155) TaxID=660469 RepID=A0A9P5CMK5_CRYP1|nr:response to light stimulus [Cryphonectria parasitica EP155]KAF3764208.1 response to light stimulus [Cryphonectria parasitica EP155]
MNWSNHYIIATIFWFIATVVAAKGKIHRGSTCLMYLTGQHDIIPEDKELINPITHVVLAFVRSEVLLEDDRTEWPLFRSVESARESFAEGTQVLIAVGGWGDGGFSTAAKNASTRKAFAQNAARLVKTTGADGIDIDWEYPGGNGEDYKQVPNSEKEWEIEAYPLLLGEIRAALGPDKLMTAAVPGHERDMLAFTELTVPRIMQHLDFLNVMTYDLMNRRDHVTKHHASTKASREGLQAYISRGAPPAKLNLGLPFYVKWYKTDPEDCSKAETPIGCKTLLLEDPETGADLGRAGAFSWHDTTPGDLEASFQRALADTQYDAAEGASYYWDSQDNLWWSFDKGSNGDIEKKVATILGEMDLAGVFAWGLGEDGTSYERLARLLKAINENEKHMRDEL